MQRAEVFFIFECKLLTYRQLWKCVIVYILLGNLTTNFGCKTKTQSHDKQNSCKLKIVAGQGGWRAVKLVFAILISSFIGLAWSSWIVFCLAQLRPAPGGCRRDIQCRREERRTWRILLSATAPDVETSQTGGERGRDHPWSSRGDPSRMQRWYKMERRILSGRWLSYPSLHIDRSYFDIMSQCCAGLVRVGLEGSVEKPEWWGLSWQTHSTMGNEAHVGIQHWSLEHRGQWHTWSSAFKTL